jgi:hypothetical protein
LFDRRLIEAEHVQMRIILAVDGSKALVMQWMPYPAFRDASESSRFFLGQSFISDPKP